MRAAFSYLLMGAALAFPLAGCPALEPLSGDLILGKEDYFPFKSGITWVYTVTGDGGPYEATMSLINVRTEDGADVGDYVSSFRASASVVATRSMPIRRSAAAIQFDQQEPLLKLPVKVNDSWSAKATSDLGVFSPAQDPLIYVLGTQNLEVVQPDGSKKTSACVRVDLKGLGLDAGGAADTTKVRSPLLKRWYAPGIGVARQVMTLPPVLEEGREVGVPPVVWELISITKPE